MDIYIDALFYVSHHFIGVTGRTSTSCVEVEGKTERGCRVTRLRALRALRSDVGLPGVLQVLVRGVSHYGM